MRHVWPVANISFRVFCLLFFFAKMLMCEVQVHRLIWMRTIIHILLNSTPTHPLQDFFKTQRPITCVC